MLSNRKREFIMPRRTVNDDLRHWIVHRKPVFGNPRATFHIRKSAALPGLSIGLAAQANAPTSSNGFRERSTWTQVLNNLFFLKNP